MHARRCHQQCAYRPVHHSAHAAHTLACACLGQCACLPLALRVADRARMRLKTLRARTRAHATSLRRRVPEPHCCPRRQKLKHRGRSLLKWRNKLRGGEGPKGLQRRPGARAIWSTRALIGAEPQRHPIGQRPRTSGSTRSCRRPVQPRQSAARRAIGSASCRGGGRQQGLVGTCCTGSDAWHTATDLVTKANALIEDFADLLRNLGGKSRLQLGYQRLSLLHDGDRGTGQAWHKRLQCALQHTCSRNFCSLHFSLRISTDLTTQEVSQSMQELARLLRGLRRGGAHASLYPSAAKLVARPG